MEFQEEFYKYCKKENEMNGEYDSESAKQFLEETIFGPSTFIPKRENKVVITSGFFNPIHSGHRILLKEAKKLGDKLIVIVNNDAQIKLKGSCEFQDENERADHIKDFRYVDDVFIAIDKDITIAESIRYLKADILAKGGDRQNDSCMPKSELDACKEVGCEIKYGIGGFDKKNSSSALIKRMVEHLYNSGKLMEFMGKMNKEYKKGKTEQEAFACLLDKFRF